MSNLPDRLGDSDTSALLKHGRAYGVTVAIAVGAIAYMSGGISGVEMGGAVAATAPAPAAAAWFQEDWDYSSTANLHSDPNGWLTQTDNRSSVVDSMRLVTGLTLPSGNTKAVRDTLEVGVTGNTATEAAHGGFDLALTTADKTEIWLEFEWRASSNWQTSQTGGAGNADHKLFLTQTTGSAERWSIKIGNFSGDGMGCYNAVNGNSAGTLVGANLDAPTDAWDGAWHTIRAHFKMASDDDTTADGAIQCWFDGVKIHEDLTYTSEQSGSQAFTKFQIGQTFNHVVAGTLIWHEYGRVVAYDTDPGWS